MLWAVMALVTFPLVAVAAIVATRSWFPTSDWALIEAKTRDVGTATTPLLGPFSRYGWNHPGPTMFWLLAPAYRITGNAAAGLMAGAALFNAAMVAAGTAVSRRVGGRSLLVAWGVAAAVFVHAAADMLIDPWNPYIAVLPFAVFVMAAWGLSTGVWWLAPVVVATGSFAIHSHVGYGLVVPPVVLWAVVAALPGLRRSWTSQRRTLVAAGVTTVAVAAVMWAAPLAEQVTADPGNVSAIVTYFTSPSDEPAAGWGAAADVVGRSLAPFAPWLGFAEPIDPDTLQVGSTALWWALPLLVALGVGVAAAARRRDRVALLGAATVGVALAISAFAVSRISGVAFFYIVRWWWALGMLAWMLAVWMGWRAAARWATDRLRTAGLAAALVVTAAFGVATVVEATDLPNPGPQGESAALSAMAGDLVAALPTPSDGEAYWVVPRGFALFETFFGVVNLLDGEGIAVVTDPDFIAHFGEHRTIGGRRAPEPGAGTIVVVSGEVTGDFADNPEWELIASYDPLTDDQRAELTGLQNKVAAALVAQGRTDEAGWVRDRRVMDLVRNEPLGLTPDEARSLTKLAFAGDRQRVYVNFAAGANPQ